MRKAVICLCILALAGCDQLVPVKQSNQQQQQQRPQSPQSQSAMGDAVDTVVIQKGKLHAGQRAADKVRAVSAQRESDISEVMTD